MDGVDASSHRKIKLRHAPSARRPFLRRQPAASLGFLRPLRPTIREPPGVDGDRGQPRDRGHPNSLPRPFRLLQLPLAHALRGERLDLQPLLLVRHRRRRCPCRHAGLLRRLQLQLPAVRVAGGRLGQGRPEGHPVALRAPPRALVQHQRGAPGRGREHETSDGIAALRSASRRCFRRARPCLRTLHEDLRQQGGSLWACVRNHRRRRKQRRASTGVRPESQVGFSVAVARGELRARRAQGGQRDARSLDVAPQRRRLRHRAGRGVADEPRRLRRLRCWTRRQNRTRFGQARALGKRPSCRKELARIARLKGILSFRCSFLKSRRPSSSTEGFTVSQLEVDFNLLY